MSARTCTFIVPIHRPLKKLMQILPNNPIGSIPEKQISYPLLKPLLAATLMTGAGLVGWRWGGDGSYAVMESTGWKRGVDCVAGLNNAMHRTLVNVRNSFSKIISKIILVYSLLYVWIQT